jgi:peptidoglycan/xylan/chitin deacetylase (PgdA/CDA1 family)
MYHRVLPRSEAEQLAVEPGMYVTPETFRRHLDWLQQDFRVLSLSDILSRLEANQPLPRGACALTFDDGWKDNHDHALPALRAAEMPATVFLVSERVGTEGAFWPDEVCRRMQRMSSDGQRAVAEQVGVHGLREPIDDTLTALKALSEDDRQLALDRIRQDSGGEAEPARRELLDWQEVERMAGAGIEFESHGASHAILTGLDPERAASELRRSLQQLEERGHARARILAYPSGGYDARVLELSRQAGYRAAVTTELGLAAAESDPLALPRVGLHEGASATRVAFRRVMPGAARRVGSPPSRR